MDSVVADPASDHVNDVSSLGRLDVALPSVRKFPGHYSQGSAIYQRFADISLVENYGPVDRWDTRFVPSGPYA